jgi:putative ABC transport system substrate-binding protein
MSEDTEYAMRFLYALCATVVKPISDLRLLISGLSAALFALCFAAEAQQPAKILRIGYVRSFGTAGGRGVSAFIQGLKDLGYVEGQNIQIEYRHPKGNFEGTPDLVAELVERKVDVIVAVDTSAIRSAKQATKTIPIIMVTNQDPVATGLVDSLARPGGNVTGVTRLTRELSGKRLELLQEVVPRVTRVGVLWVRPTTLGTGSAFENYVAAAHAFKIQLESLQVSRPNPDLEGAFQTAVKRRASAFIAVNHAVLSPHSKKIADLAIKNRLPLLAEISSAVEAGGLISYAADEAESYRRAAGYVDKILKGAKPADLPVEQPTKFEFVINLKTAKALNLTIPQSVLFRADRVIK